MAPVIKFYDPALYIVQANRVDRNPTNVYRRSCQRVPGFLVAAKVSNAENVTYVHV